MDMDIDMDMETQHVQVLLFALRSSSGKEEDLGFMGEKHLMKRGGAVRKLCARKLCARKLKYMYANYMYANYICVRKYAKRYVPKERRQVSSQSSLTCLSKNFSDMRPKRTAFVAPVSQPCRHLVKNASWRAFPMM